MFSQAYDLNLIIKTQPHCQGSAHNIHTVSIMGTTVVNCPARKTRGEQYSQLYCLKTRDIHRPTLMGLLSSQAVMQRLTENERWRAIECRMMFSLNKCMLEGRETASQPLARDFFVNSHYSALCTHEVYCEHSSNVFVLNTCTMFTK